MWGGVHTKSASGCKFLLLHCCFGNCKRRNESKYVALQQSTTLEIFHVPVMVGFLASLIKQVQVKLYAFVYEHALYSISLAFATFLLSLLSRFL